MTEKPSLRENVLAVVVFFVMVGMFYLGLFFEQLFFIGMSLIVYGVYFLFNKKGWAFGGAFPGDVGRFVSHDRVHRIGRNLIIAGVLVSLVLFLVQYFTFS